MTSRTNALLVFTLFICGLERTVLCQYGHCTDSQCFALFGGSVDFPGAQKTCQKDKGQLIVSLEDVKNLRVSLPGKIVGSYWLELRGVGRTTAEDAAGLQNCSSITVSKEQKIAVQWKPCHEQLNGFLCQYAVAEPCRGLPSSGGAAVRYTAIMGFEVINSDRFPVGTIAVVKKVGAKYLDSKHICGFSDGWMRSPWTCEVLKGGCEHGCDSTTGTCFCPAGRRLHPNGVTCGADPCADCAHSCQGQGDSYACTCNEGYELAPDRRSCKEMIRCTGENEELIDITGELKCGCKLGFDMEDGVCVNVSNCEKCEHMKCTKDNECLCNKGFKVSAKDPTKCELDCTEKDCPAICIKTSEGEGEKKKDLIQCFCPDGYIRDNMGNGTDICTDIDECEHNSHCQHGCENVFGGYRCLCNEGYKPHGKHKCVPVDDEVEEGSGSTPRHPTPPTPASVHPSAVPSYVKMGSALGIAVFALLCAALLLLVLHNVAKRCGRFELSALKHPDIDIFYLQQVTTETYKRLSFDKQSKNDPPIL